jgi:hypothetical protein
MRFIFSSLFCVLLANKIWAQPVLRKSQVQLTAKDLVFKTQAGYLTARTSQAAAITDPCANLILCDPKALPVKLLNFSGARSDDANVVLFWETTQEVNNDYFQIERTLNPGWGFQPVGTVQGAGSSASTVKYQTKDPNDHSGYTYYRLKQVDFDGSFEYSSIIGIKGASVPLSVTAFPNPGQSKEVVFKVNGQKLEEDLEVVIYDVRGKTVYHDDNHPFSPEKPNIRLPLPDLPVGKYSIKIKSKREQTNSSFVVTP